MTDDMMNLRSHVEKSAVADLLRSCSALFPRSCWLLRSARRPARAMARRMAFGLPIPTAIATGTGRHGLAPSGFAFRSFAPAAISRAFLTRRMAEKALTAVKRKLADFSQLRHGTPPAPKGEQRLVVISGLRAAP